MSEQNATSTLRTNLLKRNPLLHVQRFEDKLSAGIPDMMASMNNRTVWLEGKYVDDHPVRDTTLVRPGLKPEQHLWWMLHTRAGGTARVWVRDWAYGWYLFPNEMVPMLVKGMSLADWRSLAWNKNSLQLCFQIEEMLEIIEP